MKKIQRDDEGTALPGVAIPPGETLLGELVARGITQTDFARSIHRPLRAINEIIKGKKAITAQTALDFESALDIPARLWMRMEVDYQLTRARLSRKAAIKAKAGKRKLVAR